VRSALVVFAKWPEPGQVKTRLCPPFSPDLAAALYGAMLDDVLAAMAREAPALGLELWLAIHPRDRLTDFVRRAPGYRVVVQQGADLSARMEHVARQAFAEGVERVLLRGSDSPALAGALLASALTALEGADLALSPDPDGGYSLVALRRFAPGLFAHPMSTGSVLADTLAAARARTLSHALLDPSFDIDRAADLSRLAPDHQELCPRTLAWLGSRTRS
jgi:rSAM/selenodomain-associated transferase 1